MSSHLQIAASPDGRKLHISETAHRDPELSAKELLLEDGKRIIAEITAIDQRIGGLCMTPTKFRAARMATLLAERELKVAEYKLVKKMFKDPRTLFPKHTK